MVSSHKFLRTLFMTVVVMAVTLIGAFAAEYAVVEVDVDQLNLRTGTGTEHEIVAKLQKGNLLLVETAEDAAWYPVIASEHGTGFISAEYVKAFALESGEEVFGLGRVNTSLLNVRAWASTEATRIGQLSMNSRVTLLEYIDGWYKIALESGEGYVSAEFITLCGEANVVANSELGGQIVQTAMQYLNHRYVYGGSSPSGFDCSGFTMYVYSQFGYSLSHGATSQYNTGVRISKDELQAGDLVFFNPKGNRVGHVGIYIGDGMFIHASTREYLVRTDTLYSGYYCNNYIGASRVI